MLRFFRKLFHNKKGQGMTEYIIIVVMIAVAAIVVWRFFGARIKKTTEGAGMEIEEQIKEVKPSEGVTEPADVTFE